MSEPLRELILWRHAKSDWSQPELKDIERPLAERGRRNAKKMAHWIQQQSLQPDLILCSPAKRAQQTLKRLCKDCKTQVQTLDQLYMAEVNILCQTLAEVHPNTQSVMLIGHNPGLEGFIRYLQGSSDLHQPQSVKLFPTAAVARFVLPANWNKLKAGAGKLISITRPKDI